MKTELRAFRHTTNGMRFDGLEAGEGDLVLCFHGFPDQPQTWADLIGKLGNAGFRAVAPCLRGYSPQSKAPDGKYHSWATGTDVLELIESLGYRDAIVVGHDWGATAAYAAAAMKPEAVRRLITLAVPYGPSLGHALISDGDQQRRSWYWYFFQLPLAEAAIVYNDFSFIDRLWAEWSPGYLLPGADRAALKERLSQPGVINETLAYYRQLFANPEAPAELQQVVARIGGAISVPTLYLHGANDGCIGANLGEQMAQYFTNGLRRVVVPGAGHFLHLEKPERVAQEILAFIASETVP
jgi:pimeloyl-ACP methyl ester carboxylesterase